MTIWCLIPNFICYGLASLLYLVIPFSRSFGFSTSLANLLTLFGCFLQIIYLGFFYFYRQGYPFIHGPIDMLAFLSLGLVLLYLWFVWRVHWSALGSFFVPLALILFLFSLGHGGDNSFFPHGLIKPSWLIFVHVLFASLGLFFMLSSAILGVVFWLHERRLKNKKWDMLTQNLPPLLLNEKKALALLRLGFAALTIVLITGSVLLGRFERLMPQKTFHIVLALAAWMIYALVINRRWLGVQGRKILLLSFLGFVSLAALFLWN